MTMQYRAVAFPKKVTGLSFKDVEHLTKPSAAMSLKTILDRFVRGESVEIGKDALDGEDLIPDGIDYSKLRYADLTEKDEFIKDQLEIQQRYKRQEAKKEREKAKQEAEALKKAEEERIEEEVKKRVSSGKP